MSNPMRLALGVGVLALSLSYILSFSASLWAFGTVPFAVLAHGLTHLPVVSTAFPRRYQRFSRVLPLTAGLVAAGVPTGRRCPRRSSTAW